MLAVVARRTTKHNDAFLAGDERVPYHRASLLTGRDTMKKALLALLIMLGIQGGLLVGSVSPSFAEPCCNGPK
jgi:hypothetical protein